MKKKHGRGSAALMIAVVIVMAVLMMFQSFRLKSNISESKERLAYLEKQIGNEEKRTEEIKAKEIYMQSDEYKEKMAKEKLGLVKDGEIVFKQSK
jgi:cell division protein DivIC